MNTTPIRHTETWLNTSSKELEAVLNQVKQLSALQQKVIPHLHPSLAPYCQVANVTQGKLVLLVANGAVATQLRFQSLELLRRLQDDPELSAIKTISIKVRPAPTQTTRIQNTMNKTPASLSNDAAEAIEATADALEDQTLKEIMLKIAKHRHHTK